MTFDYSYTIQKSRYGLYTSVFADGTRGTTALTEEACDYRHEEYTHPRDYVANGTESTSTLGNGNSRRKVV